jgi:hypothetical protein
MAAVLVVAGLAFAAIVFLFAMVGLVLKLAFRLIFFPLFLLKWIVMGLVMLVVGLVLALVALVLTFVFGVLLSIPLLPFLAVAAILWVFLVRANRGAAVV